MVNKEESEFHSFFFFSSEGLLFFRLLSSQLLLFKGLLSEETGVAFQEANLATPKNNRPNYLNKMARKTFAYFLRKSGV